MNIIAVFVLLYVNGLGTVVILPSRFRNNNRLEFYVSLYFCDVEWVTKYLIVHLSQAVCAGFSLAGQKICRSLF